LLILKKQHRILAKIRQGKKPSVTLKGNLVDDAQVKQVNEDYVINYTVATNNRKQDESGNWVNNGEPTYLNGSIWTKDGAQAASNGKLLTKGTSVIVTGQMRSRSYVNKEGLDKSVIELLTDDIGLALKKYSSK
jgi:single-strand DNA-binding protein